jgi:hypothetical protein
LIVNVPFEFQGRTPLAGHWEVICSWVGPDVIAYEMTASLRLVVPTCSRPWLLDVELILG